MDAYFYYFYNFMRHIFDALYAVVIAIGNAIVAILDVPFYLDLFNSYKDDLSPLGWVAAIITHILVYILFALIVYLIARGIKVLFKFKVRVVDYEKMRDEVVRLKKEIMRANYEKDKILAMKVSDMGIQVDEKLAALNGENSWQMELDGNGDVVTESVVEISDTADAALGEEESAGQEPAAQADISELRFPKLSRVDYKYLDPAYVQPYCNNTISLEELCTNFRNYAASRLGLYYDLEVIKQAIATFGTTKMLILQGISGTGKTSLPYALGQFLQSPALICSVQPSWRDRTELFGYYNDFTRKYTETEFLKAVYEAGFCDEPKVIIMDEMNIARVEYYFAEMLSLLELPRPEERYFSLVSSQTDTDPVKMYEGKLWIPDNVWYVGTINNDDSTFAVADKVYDRAIPIDLDDRVDAFDAPDTEPMHISYTHLAKLYQEARATYHISDENLVKLRQLDDYLIGHFRLTFGNRILKQITEYIPCYIACGGTELDGLDFMFAKKILRKFDSLGIGFIRDELDGLILCLDNMFGMDNFHLSKEYLHRLKKMSGSE